MIRLPPDFKELLELLNSRKIKNKNTVTIDATRINFISLDDLKKNKKASGRYKDLDDLEHL